MDARDGSRLAKVLKVLLDVTWFAGLAFVLIAMPLLLYAEDGWIQVPVVVGIPEHLQPTFHGIRARGFATEATVHLPSLPTGAAILICTQMIVTNALVFAIISFLRRIFRTLAAGMPFAGENARRLRVVGALVLVGEIVRVFFHHAITSALVRVYSQENLFWRTRLDFNSSTLFLGLALIVVAQVAQRGAEMEKEHALTV